MGGSINGMNTNSSQMELVQSWALGHPAVDDNKRITPEQQQKKHPKKQTKAQKNKTNKTINLQIITSL
jgi:hypothetical protein